MSFSFTWPLSIAFFGDEGDLIFAQLQAKEMWRRLASAETHTCYYIAG